MVDEGGDHQITQRLQASKQPLPFDRALQHVPTDRHVHLGQWVALWVGDRRVQAAPGQTPAQIPGVRAGAVREMDMIPVVEQSQSRRADAAPILQNPRRRRNQAPEEGAARVHVAGHFASRQRVKTGRASPIRIGRQSSGRLFGEGPRPRVPAVAEPLRAKPDPQVLSQFTPAQGGPFVERRTATPWGGPTHGRLRLRWHHAARRRRRRSTLG